MQILPACYGCHLEPKSNTGRGAFVHRFGSFVLVVAVECKPFDDGFIAEPFAQPVDRLLGLGAAAVDEVGEIGSVGVAERREADADQAIDRLRERFGDEAVIKGLALDGDDDDEDE